MKSAWFLLHLNARHFISRYICLIRQGFNSTIKGIYWFSSMISRIYMHCLNRNDGGGYKRQNAWTQNKTVRNVVIGKSWPVTLHYHLKLMLLNSDFGIFQYERISMTGYTSLRLSKTKVSC